MSESKVNYSCSLGLMNMVFIVFLVLKLTKTIDWSWWWIVAPLWGQVVLFIGVFAFLFLVELIASGKRGR